VPKFGTKVPHLRSDWHTSFKVKRSKLNVTKPINADTHRAPYLTNGKAYELQTWYTDGGRRSASVTTAMTSKIKGQGRKVTWSVWAVLAQWLKSKTNSRSITKIGRKVPMICTTLRTSFKVRRSKVRSTDRLTPTHKMCHIFRTVRPKNFQVGVRMEDVDSHQRQAPWPPKLKVKVTRSHDGDVMRSTIMNFNNHKSKISKRNLYSKWNVQIT